MALFLTVCDVCCYLSVTKQSIYIVRIEKMTLYGIPVFINYLTLFTSQKSHFSQFIYYYSLNVIHVIQKNCRDRNYQYINNISTETSFTI